VTINASQITSSTAVDNALGTKEVPWSKLEVLSQTMFSSPSCQGKLIITHSTEKGTLDLHEWNGGANDDTDDVTKHLFLVRSLSLYSVSGACASRSPSYPTRGTKSAVAFNFISRVICDVSTAPPPYAACGAPVPPTPRPTPRPTLRAPTRRPTPRPTPRAA
jgi:hypothetical protein